MAKIDKGLANRILIGLVLGAVSGALVLLLDDVWSALGVSARWLASNAFEPLGQVFLRMLFFVVIPLVFASLALGVAQLPNVARLGPLAGRTFALFFANMAIAVALGLVVMNLLEPGNQIDAETRTRLVAEYGGAAQKHIERQATQPELGPMTVIDMFMPRNLFGAFVGNDRNVLGEVLPLILFSILLGAAAARLSDARRQSLVHGLEIANDLMTGIVHFALRLAPYAVFAMIFSVVVKIGWQILAALGLFFTGCFLVMLLHLFGTMSIWIRWLTKFRPLDFWRRIRPALVTAFSTSSSSATLPAALTVAKEDLGLRASTAGFVLPLGTTMNMAGTALYEGCVVLFVAQVFGIELGFAQQITLLLLAVLGAVAVAAIPGGSLPIIAGLLITFGIPPEGIGIVLGVDRLLDMTRTMVNVGADIVTTAAVDALEPR
jgi:DAACS family dicarboxylate/amino acid:cation (Na+ or H+) symporter